MVKKPVTRSTRPHARRHHGASRRSVWALGLGLVMALGVAACGGRGGAEQRRAKPGPAPAPAKAAPPAKQDATPEQQAPAVVRKPLEELFSPGAIGMPQPLVRAHFGMEEEALRKLLPSLVDEPSLRPEEFPGVTIRVQSYARSKRLRLVQVALPAEKAAAMLEARWGAPYRLAGDARCWTNAAAQVQGSLSGDGVLVLREYAPWWSILGVPQPAPAAPAADGAEADAAAGGGERGDKSPAKPATAKGKGKKGRASAPAVEASPLGFETAPLLGMPLDQVKTVYADSLRDSSVISDARVVLNVAPHECQQAPTFVDLTLKEGKVARVNLKLSFGADAAMRDSVAAALKAKYGEPTAQKDNVVTHKRGAVKVIVSRDDAKGHYSLFLSSV